MLRYEFRGKDKDNNWVHGDLIHGVSYKKDNLYILPLRRQLVYVPNCDPLDGVHVKKETVGRLIGKKDIKDIPIYEGDICKFKFMEEPNKPIELIGSFAWNDEDLRYEIDIYSNEYPEYICLYYIGNGQIYDFEIIGNIFDNAELLNN